MKFAPYLLLICSLFVRCFFFITYLVKLFVCFCFLFTVVCDAFLRCLIDPCFFCISFVYQRYCCFRCIEVFAAIWFTNMPQGICWDLGNVSNGCGNLRNVNMECEQRKLYSLNLETSKVLDIVICILDLSIFVNMI